MYDYLISYYNVDVFKHTIFDEWLKYKTEKFKTLEEAIAYARHEIKHGNHAKVYEVSKVVGWE
jgi:hypothetical protein